MTEDDRAGAADQGEERAPDGSRRVQDRRAPWRVWVPTYVIRTYGPKLGPHGLSLYLALAWHCTREAATRWPSYGQLAELVGCSRSTIERTMRQLRDLQLVETTPCVEPSGQKSNWIFLTDPPGEREQGASHGAPIAGAVPEPAPPCLTDRGAPAVGQGGAVPETAPSLDPNKDLSVCGNGDTHTVCAREGSNALAACAAALVELWISLLRPGTDGWRAAHRREVEWEITELLRRGWTADQLRASIEGPGRDRAEWPRAWRAREHAGRPKVAKTPPSAAEEAQRRTQAAALTAAAAAAAAELQAAGGFAAEMKRRRRGSASAMAAADAPLTDPRPHE